MPMIYDQKADVLYLRNAEQAQAADETFEDDNYVFRYRDGLPIGVTILDFEKMWREKTPDEILAPIFREIERHQSARSSAGVAAFSRLFAGLFAHLSTLRDRVV